MWHDFVIQVLFESRPTNERILNVAEWNTQQIGYNALSQGVSAQYAGENEVEVDPMSSEEAPGSVTRQYQTRMKPELSNL